MKTMHILLALALALLLVACGGPAAEPAPHADEHEDEHASTDHEHEGEDDATGVGEDRTTIAADIATEAGIRVAPAGPGTIADEHVVQGLLTPVEGRIASVAARFPGPIRSLGARVGDTVRAGQVLAVIESNLSLSDYEVTAPISGTVLARHAALGAMAGDTAPLYEIADLRTLWVDLHVFGNDAGHFRAGLPVEVTRLTDGVTASSMIDRLLPGVATASQSTIARATVANNDGLWRPGAAVRARITVAAQPAALVVPLTALQSFESRDVVFVRSGETYEARSVELGVRDTRQVQVLAGLAPGEEVVVEQSYVVKADLEKAGATHEH
jgi:cobalt-zinc-cadmium efflux system membrane fusion protein